jgi:pyridoxine 5-phosphate synthase
MMRLGVNVDHIATVRQARRGTFPDPIEAALVCQRSGADSIVCHLREDRRHIQDEDVRRLKRELSIPLNLEMSIAKEIVEAALDIKPSQVTLVPERRQELTTEGGLDVVRLRRRLRPLIKTFEASGIRVSLFVDPVRDQLRASQDVGASIIELHTGGYATAAAIQARKDGGHVWRVTRSQGPRRPPGVAGEARRAEAAVQPPGDEDGRRGGAAAGPAKRDRYPLQQELDALRFAAAWGRGAGMAVAAGHGLDYDNIRPIVEIPEIEEVNIGFSIIGQALFTGLERAVRDMVELLQRKSDAVHAA